MLDTGPAPYFSLRAQELCESRGDRPGLPVPNSPYGLCGRKATLENRTQELCQIEVADLGSPSLTVLVVYVDVKLLREPRAVSTGRWSWALTQWGGRSFASGCSQSLFLGNFRTVVSVDTLCDCVPHNSCFCGHSL